MNCLKGKLVYAFGDSIVYGHTDPEHCFMKLIEQADGISLGMYAVNGATVMKSENDIMTQIENAPKQIPDVIVFDGYTNDAYEKKKEKFGDISSITSADDSFFCTAFDHLLRRMRQKWGKEVPVIFVTIHKSGGRDWKIQCQLRELSMAICKKWDVTIADIFSQAALDTREPEQMKSFIIDGAGSHPNLNACTDYYVPIVRECICNCLINEKK